MSVNEVYEVKLTSVFLLAEECLNVFHYQQNGGSEVDAAEQLADQFELSVLAPLVGCLSPSGAYTRLQITNINRPTDFEDRAFSTVGASAVGGNPLIPSWVVKLRSSKPPPGQRYSYKAFIPPRSNAISSTGTWSAAYRLEVAPAAAAMSESLVALSSTFVPVQIRSGYVYGVAPTVNRLLNDDWSMNIYPSTQNSRKDAFYAYQAP